MDREEKTIKPFKDCQALDGYHCQTNSAAKVYAFYGQALSEDLLLGLGAGMGFFLWHEKGMLPFVSGRANLEGFFSDIAARTGCSAVLHKTSSPKKAEKALLAKLHDKTPVMLYGDMGVLPWFHFRREYHFGGHTFVICGYDGHDTVLASDIDQESSGLKKGFYHPIALERLRAARDSRCRPMPPRNAYLEWDCQGFRPPGPEEFLSAIRQAAQQMLQPPACSKGIQGIRHTAEQIKRWPALLGEAELRGSLFNLYVFIEIGGTGGGCFRTMYARFLQEAAAVTGVKSIQKALSLVQGSGLLFSSAGRLFQDVRARDLPDKIAHASEKLTAIADLEEEAFQVLWDQHP